MFVLGVLVIVLLMVAWAMAGVTLYEMWLDWRNR